MAVSISSAVDPGGPADRARPVRRRSRLLLRDLQPSGLRRGRHRRRVRPGQPLAVRRRRARCAGCTTRSPPSRRPSWSAWCAARSSTSRSTCAAARRPSARHVAGHAQRRRMAASCSCRSASPTASAPWSPTPRWSTRSPHTTAASTTGASAGTTRTWASTGRSKPAAAVLSAKDMATAPAGRRPGGRAVRAASQIDRRDAKDGSMRISGHRRRRLHRLGLRADAGARARTRGAQPRQADLCREPRRAGGGGLATRATGCCRPTSASGGAVAAAFAAFAPDAVVHLAAESHVDRSIDGPGAFVQTNVVGTYVMLDAALAYWRALAARAARGLPLRPCLDRRGLRLARARGPVHRDHALRPELALCGEQGRGRSSGARLAPHLRPAGDRHQLLEQLRPLPVSREADPAHHHQGRRRRAAAGLRQGRERARLDPCRGPRCAASMPR